MSITKGSFQESIYGSKKAHAYTINMKFTILKTEIPLQGPFPEWVLRYSRPLSSPIPPLPNTAPLLTTSPQYRPSPIPPLCCSPQYHLSVNRLSPIPPLPNTAPPQYRPSVALPNTTPLLTTSPQYRPSPIPPLCCSPQYHLSVKC